MTEKRHPQYLLTPGPLTTSLAVKKAMQFDKSSNGPEMVSLVERNPRLHRGIVPWRQHLRVRSRSGQRHIRNRSRVPNPHRQEQGPRGW